jgi:hypothetical protein
MLREYNVLVVLAFATHLQLHPTVTHVTRRTGLRIGFSRAERCMRLPRHRHTVTHHKQPAPAALTSEAQNRRTLRPRVVKYLKGLVQRLAKEQAQAVAVHTKGFAAGSCKLSQRRRVTL